MRAALILILTGCAAGPAPPADPPSPYAELLHGATRLQVRSGGLCHRTPADERTLLTVNDPAMVRAVADCLRIPPRGLDFEITRCRCCGDPTLEFFKEEALLVAISLHHGTRVRSDHLGDEELTADSAEALCRWLALRGIAKPEEDRRKIRSR